MADASPEDMPKRNVEFYIAYAKAIEGWQFVEQAVFEIFVDAIGCAERQSAVVVNNAIRGFTERLDVSGRIFVRVLGENSELLNQWKNARESILECYKYRNELAHYTFVHYINLSNDEIFMGPYLAPPSVRSKRKQNDRELDIPELKEIQERFRVVALDAGALEARLREQLTSLRK